MALRLILVATVFAMSLPVPSRNQSQTFLNELNQELAAIVTAIKNEIPDNENVSPLVNSNQVAPEISQNVTTLPLNQTMSTGLDKPEVESPLDLAFSVIVDEFAREATLASLDEARDHVNQIPVEIVKMDLIPAPSAEDILQNQPLLNDLRNGTVHRLVAATGDWAFDEFCVGETNQVVEILAEDRPEVVHQTHRLIASLPEHWEAVISEMATFNLVETTGLLSLEPTDNKEFTDVSWWELTRLDLVEAPQPDLSSETSTVESQPNKPEIKKALRLTAEALAAWSHVFVRPY